MTLDVKIKGTGSLTTAESTTNWNSVTIGSETLEEDVFLQGSYAVSAQASNKAGELYYDVNTDFGRDLDFGPGGTEEGQLIFMWINVTTLGSLATVTNRGLAIRLYTNTTDWADFTIAGSDDLRNFRAGKGGYVCFALDPTLEPTLINGSWDTGAIELIGIHIQTTASSKTQNVMIDHITVGEGVIVSGTHANGWADIADYCTAHSSRAWGMVQYDDSEKVIYAMGKLYVGTGNQAEKTVIQDAGKYIQFIHTEYESGGAWYPMVPADYHEIVVRDSTNGETKIIDGTVVGTDRGRGGSNIIGDSGAVNLNFDFQATSTGNSAIEFYGTKLQWAEGGITGADNANYKFLSTVIDSCGQFDPVGAMQVKECLISNTLDDSGAVLWNTGLTLLGGNFINNAYGIQVDFSGSITVSGTNFADNTKDLFLTASTGLLTVNIQDSNISTAESGADTEVDWVNAVTVNVVIQDSTTTPISGARVRMFESASPYNQILLDYTNASGVVTTGYNLVGDTNVTIDMRRSSGTPKYQPETTYATIQGNFSLTYVLKEDPVA